MDKQVYIGLDASLDETSICVVDCDGKIIFETKAESDPTLCFGAVFDPTKGVERLPQRFFQKVNSGSRLA